MNVGMGFSYLLLSALGQLKTEVGNCYGVICGASLMYTAETQNDR